MAKRSHKLAAHSRVLYTCGIVSEPPFHWLAASSTRLRVRPDARGDGHDVSSKAEPVPGRFPCGLH